MPSPPSPPLAVPTELRKLGGGCDWLAIGWAYSGPKDASTSYLVSYSEADGTLWEGEPRSHVPLIKGRAHQTQFKASGLRAGVGYEFRVAAVRGIERSAWAMAPVLRTDRANQVPEPPLAPTLLDSGGCYVVRLRLPKPHAGCRSATDATLQIDSSGGGSSRSQGWVDYEAPFHSHEMDIADLQTNASVRFRLIAHNAAGRSHPGTATEPVSVCEAPPGAPEATRSESVLLWFLEGAAARLGVWVTLGALAACVLLLLAACYRRVLGSNNVPIRSLSGRSGPRYERAATGAQVDDEALDEIDSEAASFAGAYDAWSAILCVNVYVPTSIRPIQIEMSTQGISSTSALLKQLRIVVGEVAGRDQPLAPEELKTVYEDEHGMNPLLTSNTLAEVYGASKVVCSVSGVVC